MKFNVLPSNQTTEKELYTITRHSGWDLLHLHKFIWVFSFEMFWVHFTKLLCFLLTDIIHDIFRYTDDKVNRSQSQACDKTLWNLLKWTEAHKFICNSHQNFLRDHLLNFNQKSSSEYVKQIWTLDKKKQQQQLNGEVI